MIAMFKGSVDVGYEIKILTVYVCMLFISRFVYFPIRLENGHVAPVVFDIQKAYPFKYNYKPFVFLKQFYPGYKLNIFGNIAMFIPFGFTLPFSFKKLNNVIKVTLVGVLYTFFIEISQLPLYQRRTDIDDVILNTIGVFIGAVVYFAVKAIYGYHRDVDKDSVAVPEVQLFKK